MQPLRLHKIFHKKQPSSRAFMLGCLVFRAKKQEFPRIKSVRGLLFLRKTNAENYEKTTYFVRWIVFSKGKPVFSVSEQKNGYPTDLFLFLTKGYVCLCVIQRKKLTCDS